MSGAILLDSSYKHSGLTPIPDSYFKINQHNLYLYIKYYLSSLRSCGANTKSRGEVRGGGKKPWRQKGGGRARAGSLRSPVFVGGGVSHGPKNNRNYNIKINKKQKRLALEYVIGQKALSEKLYVVDSINITSGKTKDAFSLLQNFNDKSVLFVSASYDDKTFLAFRNIQNAYLVYYDELNPYLLSLFSSVVIDKYSFDLLVGNLTKEVE